MSINTLHQINYPAQGSEVEGVAAHKMAQLFQLETPKAVDTMSDGLNLCLHSTWPLTQQQVPNTQQPWMYAQIDETGNGVLCASYPSLLYALVHLIRSGLSSSQIKQLKTGLMLPASFDWNRPLYDTTLTQIARTTSGFDAERYIETLARCGFTHLEVNGLASHTAHEAGVPGEFYSQFYSYGPGLMQFVDTELTRGLYDVSYIRANLNRLKKLAALGRKYGLQPGLMAYEPRTLPDAFFERYPMLRGARVDHPFRSRKPRYTLAQDHPVSRDHYRELIQNLMQEVPDLAYLSVWTNDSGSGFEHTASLYSGRNGGPYLIREWRNHDKIARAAGESAVRWLRLMQSAAAEINPAFEVSLRIEPFKVEHDTIIDGMGAGLTIEAPSLLVRGYHLPYTHPKYPKNDGIAGTMFHTEMDPDEKAKLTAYRQAGVEPIVQYAPCSTFNMEPLLGIPYPRMLYQKLQALQSTGLKRISAIGGLLNPESTPYWPNPEVIRLFQTNPSLSIDEVLLHVAGNWVGARWAPSLVEAWHVLEDALSYMPYLPLFSNFGFVWYRLWIRPFVPDIEAIPAADRAYYERFMVTMPNNSNMNDLGRDVLFQLVDADSGAYMAKAFDEEALPRFEQAIQTVQHMVTATVNEQPAIHHVFQDLLVRANAAQCWAVTQRNLCTWVHHVYRFLEEDDDQIKDQHIEALQTMIDVDLKNTRALLDLWNDDQIKFMLTSEAGETSFIYGEDFGAQLQRKIELTEQYRHHNPYIDRDIIWRIS